MYFLCSRRDNLMFLGVCLVLSSFVPGYETRAKAETSSGSQASSYQSSGGNTPLSSVTGNTTSWTTTSSQQDTPQCSVKVSKLPGTTLRMSDKVVIRCQCSTSPKDVQICPSWEFITGAQYMTVEMETVDSSSDTFCSVTLMLKVRPDITVGRQQVLSRCYSSELKDYIGSFNAYINTPEPPPSPPPPPTYRSRLSIYMILAIVCFVIITTAVFVFFFRWQVSTRTRTRRTRMLRNSFLYPYPSHNCPTPPASNLAFQHDNPPSYNEATIMQSPDYTVAGTTVKEKNEKLATSEPDKDEKTNAHQEK